jgi:hypothetical protein
MNQPKPHIAGPSKDIDLLATIGAYQKLCETIPSEEARAYVLRKYASIVDDARLAAALRNRSQVRAQKRVQSGQPGASRIYAPSFQLGPGLLDELAEAEKQGGRGRLELILELLSRGCSP